MYEICVFQICICVKTAGNDNIDRGNDGHDASGMAEKETPPPMKHTDGGSREKGD
jgi:hypothetical protein